MGGAPLTIKLPEGSGYASITEGRRSADYAGMGLQAAGPGTF